MIKLEIDVRQAASIRQVLYKEQSIVDIREVIGSLDTQIEAELEEAAKEIQKLEEEAAPDYGVGK